MELLMTRKRQSYVKVSDVERSSPCKAFLADDTMQITNDEVLAFTVNSHIVQKLFMVTGHYFRQVTKRQLMASARMSLR